MSAGKLTTPSATLRSDGPHAVLSVSREGVSLEAEGEGSVSVEMGGRWRVNPAAPLTVSSVA